MALYPLPNKVCAYGTKEEFDLHSQYSATDSGQWVHWQDRTDLVLEGRYEEVLPLLVEFLTTLNCNFACPTCSRRRLRAEWAGVNTWGHRSDTPTAVMSLSRMKDCVDIFSVHNIPGIIWGGGDPTANPDTYEAMHYAKQRGLQSSFLTNGSMLDQSTIKTLLEIAPQLIRISLNCGSDAVHRQFHGYLKSSNYFERVIENIHAICTEKLKSRSSTIFGISAIIDDRNMNDILVIADRLHEIVEDVGHGTIDFVLLRPVYNYYDDHAVLNSETYRRISSLVATGGVLWKRFRDSAIKVVIPKTDSLKPYSDAAPSSCLDCLAYGWCTELHPNGDIFLCSERYGNPDYRIGNVFRESLTDIWQGNRRADVLRQVNGKHCYSTSCPHQSRGHHLNRIFQQIEDRRREGRIDEVRAWVEELRRVTEPTIPYFL